MKNYLYEDVAVALAEADKAGVNADGGVGFWSFPQALHYAFNPHKIRFSRWLYLVSGYAPTDKPEPIRIERQNTQIMSMRQAASVDIFVSYERQYSSGGTIEVDMGCIKIPKGLTSVMEPQGYRINSITGVSLVELITNNKGVYDTQGTLFYCGDYADESFIISGNNMMYSNSQWQENISLVVADIQGNREYTFSFDLFGGRCEFDISAIVCKFFAEELDALQLYDVNSGGRVYLSIDKRLFVNYQVVTPYTIENKGDKFAFMAVNGCKQIGESESVQEGLLNQLPLLKYEGFPLECSVLTCDTPQTIDLLPSGTLSTPLMTIVRYDNFDDLAPQDCIPAQPFYIRWINTLGGVEQYMFSERQIFKPQVKSSSLYEVDIDSVSDAMTNERAYEMTTDCKVIIGADNIEDSIFQELKKIAFSPEIEWYDMRLGKWVRVSIDKFDTAWNTDHTAHSIEITLTLPTLYTQF